MLFCQAQADEKAQKLKVELERKRREGTDLEKVYQIKNKVPEHRLVALLTFQGVYISMSV